MNQAWRQRAHRARAEIEAGALRGASLAELLRSVPFSGRDAFVDELLGIDPPPPDALDLPRGAVPYLPCGVEHILAVVEAVPVRADDQLVDLGSGLGRVVILAHLLTGAPALGVEIQEDLVRRARDRASSLAGVSFVCANAAEVGLDGSIFFLYAPFNGTLLARVVERLEEVARRRPLVVCTVDLELHDVSWLRRREPAPTVSLSIYDSLGR